MKYTTPVCIEPILYSELYKFIIGKQTYQAQPYYWQAIPGCHRVHMSPSSKLSNSTRRRSHTPQSPHCPVVHLLKTIRPGVHTSQTPHCLLVHTCPSPQVSDFYTSGLRVHTSPSPQVFESTCPLVHTSLSPHRPKVQEFSNPASHIPGGTYPSHYHTSVGRSS